MDYQDCQDSTEPHRVRHSPRHRPLFPWCPSCRGWLITVVVLDDAELVILGIVHDHHGSFVVIVTYAGPAPAQAFHAVTASIDVINLDVEVDSDLAHFGFGNTLEGQARPAITARTHGGPSAVVPVFGGLFDAEYRAPECGQACWICAVDRESDQPIRHVYRIL